MVSDWEIEEQYKDMLDDCFGTVNVAGHEYETSRLLKEVDPIAYQVGLNDYEASLEEEGDEDDSKQA